MKQNLTFKYCFCGTPLTKNYSIEARFNSKMKMANGDVLSFDKGIEKMTNMWDENIEENEQFIDTYIENLKCCGNCEKYYHICEDIKIKHPQEVCNKWVFDNLISKKRKGE